MLDFPQRVLNEGRLSSPLCTQRNDFPLCACLHGAVSPPPLRFRCPPPPPLMTLEMKHELMEPVIRILCYIVEARLVSCTSEAVNAAQSMAAIAWS